MEIMRSQTLFIAGLIILSAGIILALFRLSPIWYNLFTIGGFLLLDSLNRNNRFSVLFKKSKFFRGWIIFLFLGVAIELLGNWLLDLWNYPHFGLIEYLIYIIIFGIPFMLFFILEFLVFVQNLITPNWSSYVILLFASILFGYFNELPNTFVYEWKYHNWPLGEFLGIPILVSIFWAAITIFLPLRLLFKD